MSNKKIWEIATKAWSMSRDRRSLVKKKCESCFAKWKGRGGKEKERPPLFPPDYTAKCPACGSELSSPGIPF